MTFPLPLQYKNAISQSFGVRNRAYKSGIHNGTDYATPIGTPITAPCKGRVYRVYRDNATMGNAIYFKSEDGIYMRFLHCAKVEPVGNVEEGQYIGSTGSSGQSDGPHCHVEAWNVPISIAVLYSEKSVRTHLLDPVTLF